jgi:mycofactocin glycosyltransferase
MSGAGQPAPLPCGFGIELDQDTRQLDETTLFGGSPGRVIRLSAAGRTALAELREGPVRSAAAGVLARRLTDAGLAHPRPPAVAGELAGTARPPAGTARTGLGAADVTVIIPARDRPQLLDSCLTALGRQHPVVVVDDGSADPAAVAQVATRHGASLRARRHNGGPGAARNTGLVGIETAIVAFVDSDCAPSPGWITPLLPHFADPLVGAVAPRIVAPEISTSAGRYASACGSLDLGGREARVVPGGRVSYVPTAALLVRRAALQTVASQAAVFDTELRYGEDVDLVWRLHAAGWRIRYQPAVQVAHDGPADWPGLLAKRYRYGTSAAPLATRHPRNLAPLVLHPWPTVTVAALLARRPVFAAASLAAAWFDIASTVRRAGVPADGAVGACLNAAWQTWRGIGRYGTQFAAPALAAALIAPGGRTQARRWGRRAAAASLLIGPAVADWRERKPGLAPVTFAVARIADDVCYGAGVWAGCARERTAVPLRPAISWRPVRIQSAATAGPTAGPTGGPAEADGERKELD